MYLRTVARVSPVRRAIADTLKPCLCNSKITISSLNRTTSDLPRTIEGKVASCRALPYDADLRDLRSHRSCIEVIKIQSPDLARIHPPLTRGLVARDQRGNRLRLPRRGQQVEVERQVKSREIRAVI